MCVSETAIFITIATASSATGITLPDI